MEYGSRATALLMATVVLGACQGERRLEPPLTLPPNVELETGFERGPDGLALDMEAADQRLNDCLDQVGYSIRDISFDETMARMAEEQNFRMLMTVCQEAAGTGWGPGNQPDEVEALNHQARETTRCVRDRGWDVADPVPEEFGRFLRFNADSAFGLSPAEGEEGFEEYGRDMTECVELHSIDWRVWVQENPRN